jgi:arylsulfatase
VVLVSLDTTRADRLGCYGAARPATPHLDRLAADGTVHTRALATSSWTLPSHASLFTGRLTRSHGADYDPEGPLDLAGAVEGPAEWRSFRARPLPASERTLAEVLREGGYDTAGVVAGPWLKRPFGLDQGFEVWDEAGIDSANGRRAESVTDAALAWLDRPRRGPGFLFLNYFDPHGPYEAPEPFGRAFLPPGTLPSEGVPEGDELRARYDAEVAYMDHHLGRFLDGLRSRGLYDRALVVVTADHGELLGEHGRMGHGESLTEPELRIPLIVKLPGRGRGEPPPARSDAVVQLTDVMPIVLHALSLPIPAGVQGGLPPRVGHPIVAEVHPLPAISAGGHWRALYDGRFKLLWSSLGRHGLYELERDPGERDNLALRDRPRRERLTRLLEGYLDSLPGPGEAGPARTLDAETREALRSLGYVR